MALTPGHRNEQTGNAPLDRIQANVRDLLAFVRSLEWMRRRAYVALATDETTASSTLVDLISTTITSDAANSYLVIHATASGVKSTNTGRLTIGVTVDGVASKGASTSVAASTSKWSASVVVRVAVARGLHTVALQWATTTASNSINALSSADEHAAMSIHEEVV